MNTKNAQLLRTTQGYIDGRWVDADSGQTLAVTDPATGEQLAQVPSMGKAETNRACDAAAAAFQREAPSLDQRRQWLEQIAQRHLDQQEEIAQLLTRENGKPIAEARGEVAYAAGFYRTAAKQIDHLKPRTLEEKPKDCTWVVHHRPAGVAALITPWNFPIAMIAKKLSAAIAGGCPSIVMPSAKTPLTVIALFQILEEVGLPRGFAHLVLGPPAPIGEAICAHPGVRIVSFTGSTRVGRLLARQCADGLKRLALELGGNAPFIVFEDADPAAAADALMASKFRAGGQTCVCANRVYAHRDIAQAFLKELGQRVEALKVGHGLEESVTTGPMINRDGYDKVRRHLEDAMRQGARRVAGGELTEPRGDDWGCFFPPTVLADVTEQMTCCREETFGPLVPVLTFDDEHEAVERSNDTPYGLAAYFFTSDSERAERVALALRFGHVGHNTGTGPTPEAPFGGMKDSGYGREGGVEGLMEYVEHQTVAHGG